MEVLLRFIRRRAWPNSPGQDVATERKVPGHVLTVRGSLGGFLDLCSLVGLV